MVPFQLKLSDESFSVSPQLILLVADTPARYSVLNWISFNGYYGCCYCFNSGARNGRVHYYPHECYGMRTLQSYEDDIKVVKRNPSLKSSRGVKGPSALSRFLPHLPLSAPIDYMHQIALGVARVVLDLVGKEMKNTAREQMKNAKDRIKVSFLLAKNDF